MPASGNSRTGRTLAVVLYLTAAALLVLSVLCWIFDALEPFRELIRGNFVAVASGIALLLVVGVFADFEAGRDSPREVAAMASLAGISAAARIPFAALPNIQPCTVLILAGGYVFGSRRGFVIGAVTALVSNFYLGQGPWTLWQMLGWGLVGASGGLLARAHGVHSGRSVPDGDGGRGSPSVLPGSGFTLSGRRLTAFAALAFAWGFLYDWLLNLWWFMFYPLELRYLLVIILPGLPFDVAHAAGNIAFAIILAPFVVENLLRARERWSVVYLDDDESARKADGAAVT